MICQDVEKSLKYIFAVVPEFTFARALYDINLNSMLMDCPANTKDINEALWEQVRNTSHPNHIHITQRWPSGNLRLTHVHMCHTYPSHVSHISHTSHVSHP